MMKTIEPFNPESEEVRQKVFHILEQAPVKNLTETEVTETLHLLHLERQLTDGNRTSRFAVTGRAPCRPRHRNPRHAANERQWIGRNQDKVRSYGGKRL